MTNHDHYREIRTLVRTLEKIVEQWPECRAQALLECAKRLPAILTDLQAQELTIDRAAHLCIDNLADEGVLPPWCG
jgi:hypothetical protein